MTRAATFTGDSGLDLPAGQARDEAEDTGISQRTLERAKKNMGVISYRENAAGDKRGKGHWYWKLPVVDLVDEPSNTANATFKAATDRQNTTCGGLEHENTEFPIDKLNVQDRQPTVQDRQPFKAATPPTLENGGGVEREESETFKNANRGDLEDESEEIL